jgi:hypothetical protein
MSPTRHSVRAPKGAPLPIGLLIDNSKSGYLAIDAAVLVEAFEGARNELGLADRNDPAALVVAKYIIAFGKTGECDPVRLRDLTVEAIRQEQRQALTASRASTQAGP